MESSDRIFSTYNVQLHKLLKKLCKMVIKFEPIPWRCRFFVAGDLKKFPKVKKIAIVQFCLFLLLAIF